MLTGHLTNCMHWSFNLLDSWSTPCYLTPMVTRDHHVILTAHCTLLIRSTIVWITDLVTCGRVSSFWFGHISSTQHATITSSSKVSRVTDYKMAQTYILILNILWPTSIKWRPPNFWTRPIISLSIFYHQYIVSHEEMPCYTDQRVSQNMLAWKSHLSHEARV